MGWSWAELSGKEFGIDFEGGTAGRRIVLASVIVLTIDQFLKKGLVVVSILARMTIRAGGEQDCRAEKDEECVPWHGLLLVNGGAAVAANPT
jgi:hypothetical protein